MATRKLTKAQKENIAARQNFKCAASIKDYDCPLWYKPENKGVLSDFVIIEKNL